MFSPAFTFDSSSRTQSEDSAPSSPRDASRSVSPFTPSSPRPRHSISDLADQLDRQRIRPEAQICYDSYAAYANTDDDADWSLPEDVSSRSHIRSGAARTYSPSRRQQRQSNSRLLCSSTHHRDIAKLLSQMLESGDQCSVSPTESLSRVATREQVDDDDGSDSEEAEQSRANSRRSSVATLKFRRASDYRKTGASVSKEVRLRGQDRVHRKQKSGGKE